MTLLQALIPTIDGARQVATDLGVRLYRTFIRTRSWNGSTVGAGTYADSDYEILPRPRVSVQTDGSGLHKEWTTAGAHIEGACRVDRISATLTAALLDPRQDTNNTYYPQSDSQKVYWLLVPADGGDMDTSSGQPLLFVIEGIPLRRTTEWVVNLLRVEA